MNLPEQYLENMKELLGTDFDAYIESFNDSRLYGLRVNTMKISVEDFLKISPFKLTPIPWIETSVLFCRTLLHPGTECDDTCQCSSCRGGRYSI